MSKGKKNVNNKNTKKTSEEVVEVKKNQVVEEENFLDEKNGDHKTIVKTIFDIVFWVAIIFLFFVWIVDFVRVKKSISPKFCISKSEYTCDNDGAEVNVCTGLGYKVYTHKTDDATVTEFRPIFASYKEVK